MEGKGCKDCKYTGFYCGQACCLAHYCHCEKALQRAREDVREIQRKKAAAAAPIR